MARWREHAKKIAGSLTLLLVGGCWHQARPALTPAPTVAHSSQRPNILLIVADDLGYSDVGAYGGEIHTPNIDALAARGTRFSNFYAAPTCSTTRSMLLSGVDSHRNGLGALDEGGVPVQGGEAGYEGYLNFDVATMPELLRASGYHSYMAGKWHLGAKPGTGPDARGFERSFELPGGAAAHFGRRGATSRSPIAKYREDGKPVAVPDNFYSSSFYTDKLIEYLKSNAGDGRPFFAYAAYTAPHWPIQAPKALIDKYEPVYSGGYDPIRARRMARLEALGLIESAPASASTGHGAVSKAWRDLSPAERARERKLMQVYAAMVESLDENIGRLITYLRDSGQIDNTVIIFMSDNGPEGNDPYQILDNKHWVPGNWKTDTESLGSREAFASYGPGWAEVSATPFRHFKAFTGEGGIRVPGIFVLPERTGGAHIARSVATVLDIMPTVLELARVPFDGKGADGRAVLPLAGRSLLPVLAGGARATHPADERLGWELFGRRALRQGDWKLLWIDQPYGPGAWQLFDLRTDPFEHKDLSAARPDKLAQMIVAWDAYARANNVKLMDYSDLQYGKINHHYEH